LWGSTAAGGVLLMNCFWDESLFLRLVNLANELGYRLPHVAGLNPRAFKARYCKVAPALGGGYPSGPPLLPDRNGLLQVCVSSYSVLECCLISCGSMC
jgi:cleavage and polyadenylation specificity factor subunit 1